MKFGEEYFITNYSELVDYLNFFINYDREKKIKYIFTNGSSNRTGKMLDTEIFIAFDNDTILKIDYKFYSLMYVRYMWTQSLNEKEYNSNNYILDLDVSNVKIENFEIEQFTGEYEINPSEGTLRPDNTLYFRKVVFKLSNEKNLCICAEDTQNDGYCDIWVESNIRNKENNQGQNDSFAEIWAKTNLNVELGTEHNNLIPFNEKRFNMFSLAYHHDLMDIAGLWGFKDKNGNLIIEPKFLFEPICVNQKYIVCVGSGWKKEDNKKLWCDDMKWGVIDLDFNTVIPFEYDEIEYLENDDDFPYFVCYKYKYETTGLKWVTIFNYYGEVIIPEKYNDVGYYIENNQLIVYKDRERTELEDKSIGYAGIYDFKLNKEIIKPNKYRELEYLDYNIFLTSDDTKYMEYASIIDNKGKIIGKEKMWQLVFKLDNVEGYKYRGRTMNNEFYYFNIKNSKIVDMLKISEEEWDKTYYKRGEKSYKFSEWNTQIIQTPQDLMLKLKKLKIKGRKIESIECLGMCYNLKDDRIEDLAYNYYSKKDTKNLKEITEYENIIENTLFIRYIEIDEPIILYLDNGDKIEIDYKDTSSLKIDKNSLPQNIRWGINPPNADINVIFSNCLKKKILGFEVVSSDELKDDFTGAQGISKPINQDSYISKFRLKLENDIYIEFSNYYDYAEITIFEDNNKSMILWRDLKKGIKKY